MFEDMDTPTRLCMMLNKGMTMKKAFRCPNLTPDEHEEVAK